MGKKKQKRDTVLPSAAELLAELVTLDSVEVIAVSGADHDAGVMPSWSELRLTIKRQAGDDVGGDYPFRLDVPLRRHDGELIIEVLWQVLHPDTPTSASEQLWDGLDGVVERIQTKVEAGEEPYNDDVVIARTLCTAIAIMNRPYDPDVDEVREVAMTRWAIRHN